jgi:PhnB protein
MAILNPYLNFRTGTREAMEFYQSVLGGELRVSTFADFGAAQDPAENDLIMHAMLTTPSGFTLMAADVPPRMGYSAGENAFAVSLSGGGDAEKVELAGYFDALAAGGTVLEPLTTAPWGDTFGMVLDRFGVTWLINIAATVES